MDQARRAGWQGRSYRSAKKFERKVERQATARDPEVAPPSLASRVRHRVGRYFVKRGGKR